VYFGGHGFHCPTHVNPAEHLIDIITVDGGSAQAEEQSSQRIKALILAWGERRPSSANAKEKDSSETDIQKSRFSSIAVFRQVWYLSHRNFWISIRDPFGLGGLFLESTIMGLAVGWIFNKIPPTLTGIREMQGFIYAVLGLQGYILLISTIYKVSVDMKVRRRNLMLS
jgi:hypothetical protein